MEHSKILSLLVLVLVVVLVYLMSLVYWVLCIFLKNDINVDNVNNMYMYYYLKNIEDEIKKLEKGKPNINRRII